MILIMHTIKLSQRLFLGFFIVCVSQASSASIRYINLSPVIGQLPQIDYPTLDKRDLSTGRYTLLTASANYLSSGKDGSNNYIVDGETTTIQQTFELAIDQGLVGITNRWFQHSSGVMDQLIYDFHDMFGMPQNGRTETNKDQLLWTVESNNQNVYSLNNSKAGFGDTSIFYELRDFRELSNVRISLSMPTGTESQHTSTDTWGLAISSSLNGPQLFETQDYLPTLRTWFGAGGSILYSDHGFGELDLNPLVFAGTIGAGYDIRESFSFEAQIDVSSPYFDSDIRELGWAPLVASIAAAYRVRSANFQLGFSEDLRPSTSPDFSLFFTFHYDF